MVDMGLDNTMLADIFILCFIVSVQLLLMTRARRRTVVSPVILHHMAISTYLV